MRLRSSPTRSSSSASFSCVNWCWHSFLDPDDPEDEFVGAITIYDGPINVLEEDFHVVHHQYPGAHWTTHGKMHEKHKEEYARKRATAFRGTHAFELFAVIILQDYDMLVDKFEDLGEPKLSREEVKKMLQARLRTCWWGPRANLSIKLEGKNIGNRTDGMGDAFANDLTSTERKKIR